MLQNLKDRYDKFRDDYPIDPSSALIGFGGGMIVAGSVCLIAAIKSPVPVVSRIIVDADLDVENSIRSVTTIMSNGVLQNWTRVTD